MADHVCLTVYPNQFRACLFQLLGAFHRKKPSKWNKRVSFGGGLFQSTLRNTRAGKSTFGGASRGFLFSQRNVLFLGHFVSDNLRADCHPEPKHIPASPLVPTQLHRAHALLRYKSVAQAERQPARSVRCRDQALRRHTSPRIWFMSASLWSARKRIS
jgi:hypothetical protein